jgi:hypothetical protein
MSNNPIGIGIADAFRKIIGRTAMSPARVEKNYLQLALSLVESAAFCGAIEHPGSVVSGVNCSQPAAPCVPSRIARGM